MVFDRYYPDLFIDQGINFSYTPEKICLDLGDTIITFYGDSLRIESFSGRRLISSGLVRRIEFEQKWEGHS